jgi:integrase
MTKKRDYGSGAIEARGPNSWRLRYRIGGKVFRKTLPAGTSKTEAAKILRGLLHAGDEGTHIAPDKLTLRSWAEQWLSVRQVGQRSVERYRELFTRHILPALGDRPLQQIDVSVIEKFYVDLKARTSGSTVRYCHIILKACLAAAVRKRKIVRNPIDDIDHAPPATEGDHGRALEAHELRALVQGFKGSPLFPIVATAAYTGMRRGEILALRWSDLDAANKMLLIERSIDITLAHGIRIKAPKSERGTRTISIGDELIALLLAERDKHLRIRAGVPDGAAVDLSLVKLPDGALIFPNPPERGQDFSFTALRHPKRVTDSFVRKAAKLGYPGLRFHDLRGTVATLLLNQGRPIHAVAARLGHSPTVLLKAYAKRTQSADAAAAAVMDNLTKGVL